MKYKRLGRTGLKVSEICLGGMTFGDEADEKETERILDMARDGGINFIDTSDAYPFSNSTRSETILGPLLKGHRNETILGTKVMRRISPHPNDAGLSRKHIMDAVDNSLRRLQTDYIDLYQAHAWDPETPIDETMRAFDDLVRQGKVRYIGCSNFDAWQVCKALWVSEVNNGARFDSVQPRYNLLTRGIERELLPMCEAEELGVIPFNPLGGGFLTGKYAKGEEPMQGTRFAARANYRKRYSTDQNFETVEKLRAIADEHGRDLIHMSVAWVLANPIITSAIVGASKASQVETILGAVDVTLSNEEMEACDQVADSTMRNLL